MFPCNILGFPDSSADKESACNEGDSISISGSGRSPGEEIGYPLKYTWASLVVQLVKNLPAMWETWVWSLVWEDPLKKGKATHSGILAWRIPWTVSSTGLQRIRHDWGTFTSLHRNVKFASLKIPRAYQIWCHCSEDTETKVQAPPHQPVISGSRSSRATGQAAQSLLCA